MYTFITCFISCAAGFILGVLLMRSKPDGVLMIDVTDPEKDLYSLEFTTPLDDLPEAKFVKFQVKVKNPQD